MEQKHYVGIAFAVGALAGFFFLTANNTYGAGRWGNSTFGWVYSKSANIAHP